MLWIAFMLAIMFALTGCEVRQPARVETAFVQGSKRTINLGGKKSVNLLPANAENILAVQETFSHYCLVCHVLDGQNTGVPFVDRMSPPVPPLISAAEQRYTDGHLKWIIDNGISPSGMRPRRKY